MKKTSVRDSTYTSKLESSTLAANNQFVTKYYSAIYIEPHLVPLYGKIKLLSLNLLIQYHRFSAFYYLKGKDHATDSFQAINLVNCIVSSK